MYTSNTSLNTNYTRLDTPCSDTRYSYKYKPKNFICQMQDSLKKTRLERAAAQAAQNGGTLKTGAQIVITSYNRRPKNVDLSTLIFNDGDVITVPKWLEDPTASDDEKECWMLKPASKGGNDILSVLCDGKDASGNPIVREVSGGTLQKILIDVKNNNKPEPTRGNITEFLADCGDDVSMLKKCVGHTLTFSHPKKVSYVFRGGPTPRETEGTVWEITVA